MIRLLVTTIISFMISFGAISNSLQASELMNHVTEDHHEHSHSQDHHVHDDEDTSDETPPNDESHSHSYELSLLTQILNFKLVSFKNVNPSPIVKEIQEPSFDRLLILQSFSFAIFRPPIA